MVQPTETSSPPLTETPLPRQLSICLGNEPTSLFLYDAVSPAAKSVLAAVYDGPFDWQDFQIQAVILDKIPSLKEGDISFEPLTVNLGEALVDAGNLNRWLRGRVSLAAALNRAVSRLTRRPACARSTNGRSAYMKPGLLWSNGNSPKSR
jgi:peptide/nickel transport system substrate-binding protein